MPAHIVPVLKLLSQSAELWYRIETPCCGRWDVYSTKYGTRPDTTEYTEWRIHIYSNKLADLQAVDSRISPEMFVHSRQPQCLISLHGRDSVPERFLKNYIPPPPCAHMIRQKLEKTRARIFKLSRSPVINTKESLPPSLKSFSYMYYLFSKKVSWKNDPIQDINAFMNWCWEASDIDKLSTIWPAAPLRRYEFPYQRNAELTQWALYNIYQSSLWGHSSIVLILALHNNTTNSYKHWVNTPVSLFQMTQNLRAYVMTSERGHDKTRHLHDVTEFPPYKG